MLDVLTAIKNNNVNRIPNYDPALAEHLRKILRSLCVNGKYVTTLNIALDDLLNVQNRGKWWVVGSAWSGNISDISGASKAISNKKSEQKFSEQLLQLARKQRMNTDERRNAFCVLMSAEVSGKCKIFQKLNKILRIVHFYRISLMHLKSCWAWPSKINERLFQLLSTVVYRRRHSIHIMQSLRKNSVITIENTKYYLLHHIH